MLVALLYSFNYMLSGFASTVDTTSLTPYFYLMLYEMLSPYAVGMAWILYAMLFLYLAFFFYIVYSSRKMNDYRTLDSPLGYFVYVACAALVLSIAIVLLEEGLGISIGGTSIDTYTQGHPLLGYTSLIYAPFVEEFGFRIIPLGLLSVVLVSAKKRSLHLTDGNRREIVYAFFAPGPVRQRYGLKFTTLDWIMIVATSAVFAYGHIFFGAWDWGKFAQTFVFGLLAAVGFLKFGAYMDIPMLWVSNGIVGLYVLEPALLVEVGLFLFWHLAVGIVGVVLIVININRHFSIARAKNQTEGRLV